MNNVLKRDIFVIEMDKWFVKFLNLFSLNSFTFYCELMKLDNESFVMNLWEWTLDILNHWYDFWYYDLWYDFWYSKPLIWTLWYEPLIWTLIMNLCHLWTFDLNLCYAPYIEDLLILIMIMDLDSDSVMMTLYSDLLFWPTQLDTRAISLGMGVPCPCQWCTSDMTLGQ